MLGQARTQLSVRPTFPTLYALRAEWSITAEAFQEFLAWLDADREKAAAKYEEIRKRLIKIFVCRGCCFPEDLADETINRVIAKMPGIKDRYCGDPGRYFGGVARNVFHEYTRRKIVPAPPPEPDPPEIRERQLGCLEECLGAISDSDRSIMLRYYEGEKSARIHNRNVMAREFGKEPNALRIRVHRLRGFLHECVGECLEKQGLQHSGRGIEGRESGE